MSVTAKEVRRVENNFALGQTMQEIARDHQLDARKAEIEGRRGWEVGIKGEWMRVGRIVIPRFDSQLRAAIHYPLDPDLIATTHLQAVVRMGVLDPEEVRQRLVAGFQHLSPRQVLVQVCHDGEPLRFRQQRVQVPIIPVPR